MVNVSARIKLSICLLKKYGHTKNYKQTVRSVTGIWGNVVKFRFLFFILFSYNMNSWKYIFEVLSFTCIIFR